MKKIEFDTIEAALETSGVEQVINDILTPGDPLIIAEVPEEWQNAFRSHGFVEYAHYQDHWLDAITPPDDLYGDYQLMGAEDCTVASEISIACRGLSRGFEGEPPEWFEEWLRGDEEGQSAAGCRNAAAIVHRMNGVIAGFACTATYAHDSARGAVVWIRMLAVHPGFQGQGIGRKLLMQTLQYGADHGAMRAFLHVDLQNAAAIHLYTDVGFLPKVGEEQVDMIWTG